MTKPKFLIAAVLAMLTLSAQAGGRDVFVGADRFDHWWEAAQAGQPVPTRAEVRQAAILAIANGEVEPGEAGPALKTAHRCRAEVVAELRESIRLGVERGGEGGPWILTPQQQSQIADAGRRAAATSCAVGSLASAR